METNLFHCEGRLIKDAYQQKDVDRKMTIVYLAINQVINGTKKPIFLYLSAFNDNFNPLADKLLAWGHKGRQIAIDAEERDEAYGDNKWAKRFVIKDFTFLDDTSNDLLPDDDLTDDHAETLAPNAGIF